MAHNKAKRKHYDAGTEHVLERLDDGVISINNLAAKKYLEAKDIAPIAALLPTLAPKSDLASIINKFSEYATKKDLVELASLINNSRIEEIVTAISLMPSANDFAGIVAAMSAMGTTIEAKQAQIDGLEVRIEALENP